jgi:hypothetical protein
VVALLAQQPANQAAVNRPGWGFNAQHPIAALQVEVDATTWQLAAQVADQ